MRKRLALYFIFAILNFEQSHTMILRNTAKILPSVARTFSSKSSLETILLRHKLPVPPSVHQKWKTYPPHELNSFRLSTLKVLKNMKLGKKNEYFNIWDRLCQEERITAMKLVELNKYFDELLEYTDDANAEQIIETHELLAMHDNLNLEERIGINAINRAFSDPDFYKTHLKYVIKYAFDSDYATKDRIALRNTLFEFLDQKETLGIKKIVWVIHFKNTNDQERLHEIRNIVQHIYEN